MKVVIVGGGIAGLASAVALDRAGHAVTVLERAERYTEVGSGLSLWPNALRALEAIGLGDHVRQRSRAARHPVIRTAMGRVLARTNVSELERRFGPLLMIHRADLLDILRSALPESVVRPRMEVHMVTPDGLVAHSGGVEHAHLIVGADGIRSTVRASICPATPPPRFARYSAYRMLTDPVPLDAEGESWGRGERFGYAPLPDGRVYCFAVINTPPGAGRESIEDLRRRFRDWHDPIPALLQATSADALLHRDIYDLAPLDSYVFDRVALVGDAAHAMTPNLGQGACQAIEDAVTLAVSIDAHPTLPAALACWDSQRRPRTQAVAARSRQVGSVAQWRFAPAVTLRNGLLRLLPQNAFLRSLTPVISWTPPPRADEPCGAARAAKPFASSYPSD